MADVVLAIISLEMAVLLFVIALVAGVGISAIGPGGIFVTIALFLLVPISSAEVAGTASLTFIFTGLLAAGLFQRSGDFAEGFAREMAIILSGMSIIGAYTGSQANLVISDEVFGYLLAVFVAVVGGIILYREVHGFEPSNHVQLISTGQRRGTLGTIGFGVGFIGGLLGVGGPVIGVPILVLLGVPMLTALAVAQVQSIFISGFATAGYFLGDAVSIPIAILVGVPQLIGVVVGWRVAHLVAEGRLRIALGVVLLLISPVIAL
ncbi:sulfite exporter TauE/SafE family protein [Natronorarus salvus]|uniref:sulfite exporter TauE/SafE family protein n=1 Tax=Natronorarus salvus TaxID=3117733 RepID=UPI002F26CE7E